MAAWASIKDAAETLGVSQDTIKRRIRAGQIPARRETTTKGFRWLVELPGGNSAHPDALGDAPASAPPESPFALADALGSAHRDADAEVLLLRQKVALLEQDRTELVTELEARRREVSELHVLLQRALEQRPALVLPAPEDRPGHAIDPQHTEPAPTERQRRHWWQRLLWG